MSHGGSTRVILFSLAANLGIAVSKGVGAAFTGSASLLAESIHSVADCSNQLLLLVGKNRAAKPPDAKHPLGYGREVFFWSFMVALILFTMGGLFAIYEGVHKFSDPEPLSYPFVGLGILGVGVVLETASYLACLKEIRQSNPYASLTEWFRKTSNSDLLVIFAEDSAALAGLALAMGCLLLALATGDPRWDALGSILIGIVLVVVAFFLANETRSLLIGEAPSRSLEGPVAVIVSETIPGGKLLRFIAVQIGANEVMISYKIHPGTVETTRELIEAINETERRVRAKFPEVRWQFVEPDLTA